MSPIRGDGSPPSAPPGLTKGAEPAHLAPRLLRTAPVAPVPDTPEFLARVEAAVVDHLSKMPGQAAQMTKLGVFLRGQALAPQGGLKKFLLMRSKFAYYDENGTGWVALVNEEKKTDGRFPVPPAALPHAPPAAKPNPYAAVPPGVDEKLLERQLVSFILEKSTKESPANLPLLGEYCIEHLGFSMKGYLHRFLVQRMHLFRITDDGRQHVLLQPGAAEAVGAVGALPALPDDIMGSSSSAKPAAAASPAAPALAALARPAEYLKWDRLSQEIYDFLILKGGSASFREVDDFIVVNHRDLVEAAGVRWASWDTKKFTWKRRNIFRKDGQLLAVHQKGPSAPPAAATTAVAPSAAQTAQAAAARALASPSPTLSREEAFPPLRPASKSSSRANGAPAAPATAAVAIVSSADAAAAAKALAEERKALEALHDEVQASLNSLKALSDLQKESANLRAGYVTLGREVVALKEEMAALKSSLNNAAVGTPSSVSASVAKAPAAAADTLPIASDALFLDSVADSQPKTRGITAPTIALIGGHDSASWLDSVETYCPSTGAWGTLPSQARSFAAAAAAPDGPLYVAGGGNGTDWYNTAAVLAPGAATWRQLAPLGLERGSAAAGIVNGYLYVYGGGKPGTQYSAVEYYDPEADRWLKGPELGCRRFALAGAALEGALYAVGGYDGQYYLKTVERLDPREGSWRPVGSMAGQRGGLMCAAAGGTTLYALGGYSKTALQTCEMYDVRADAWRPIASLKDSRAYGAAAAGSADAGAAIFVLGGLRGDMRTHAPLMERYSPGKDAWEEVELPEPAQGEIGVYRRRSFLAAATLLPAV